MTSSADILTICSSTASILGLVVTGWTAWNVNAIRTHYSSLALVPRHLERIETLAEELQKGYRDYDTAQEQVAICLRQLEPNLNDLAALVPRDRKQSIAALIVSIQEYHRKPERDTIWTIYGKVYQVIEECNNYLRQREWR